MTACARCAAPLAETGFVTLYGTGCCPGCYVAIVWRVGPLQAPPVSIPKAAASCVVCREAIFKLSIECLCGAVSHPGCMSEHRCKGAAA